MLQQFSTDSLKEPVQIDVGECGEVYDDSQVRISAWITNSTMYKSLPYSTSAAHIDCPSHIQYTV